MEALELIKQSAEHKSVCGATPLEDMEKVCEDLSADLSALKLNKHRLPQYSWNSAGWLCQLPRTNSKWYTGHVRSKTSLTFTQF